MTEHEQAREYIGEMIHNRTLSAAERDILYKLLDTPRVRARFPSLSLEDLKAIADSFVEQPAERPKRRRWRVG